MILLPCEPHCEDGNAEKGHSAHIKCHDKMHDTEEEIPIRRQYTVIENKYDKRCVHTLK